MKLLSKEETAGRLGISTLSLSDKRYRCRIGLPAVRIGRRIGFAEHDVEKLMSKGREKFPVGAESNHEQTS